MQRRARWKNRRRVALAMALMMAGAATALAQTPGVQPPRAASPAPRIAVDPKLAAAEAAYGALAEAERKAIQFDLIFTGLFEGAPSGSYGPLTFQAINLFKQKRNPAAVADGLLPAAERKALADVAAAQRAAMGYQLVTDQRSGVRIGIPGKLLPKRSEIANGGSRWQSSDERVTLDTRLAAPTETLDALFERATAATVSGRRITYKLKRPDFYVVSGETATGKFYTRMGATPAGPRGFSIAYDKALAASMDLVVLAVAAGFEADPASKPPIQPGQPPAVAALPGAGLPGAPAPRPTTSHAVALSVGPGLFVTAANALKECRSVSVAGHPAQVKARDESTGLALIEAAGLAATAPGLREQALADGEGVVLLAYGDAGSARALVTLPGSMVQGKGGAPFVSAPVQPGQAGSAVFDRDARLIGIVTGNPSDRYAVAGVVPLRAYAVAGKAQMQGLLAKANLAWPAAPPSAPPASGALSTGAVSEAGKRAVADVLCTL